jgi:hypothetical protein
MTESISDYLLRKEQEKTGKPAPEKGISAAQAAAIAKEHGLGLGDAAALRQLAGSVDEAHKIAATFTPDSKRQLARADLKAMTPDEIVAAQDAGRLDDLLHSTGASAPAAETPPAGQLSRADLKAMTPDEQVAAREGGQLDHLLGITRPADPTA